MCANVQRTLLRAWAQSTQASVTGRPIPGLATTTLLQTAHFGLMLAKTPRLPPSRCPLVCLPASLRTGSCCPLTQMPRRSDLCWLCCSGPSEAFSGPSDTDTAHRLQLSASLPFLPARTGWPAGWKGDTCCLLRWTSSGLSNQ